MRMVQHGAAKDRNWPTLVHIHACGNGGDVAVDDDVDHNHSTRVLWQNANPAGSLNAAARQRSMQQRTPSSFCTMHHEALGFTAHVPPPAGTPISPANAVLLFPPPCTSPAQPPPFPRSSHHAPTMQHQAAHRFPAQPESSSPPVPFLTLPPVLPGIPPSNPHSLTS